MNNRADSPARSVASDRSYSPDPDQLDSSRSPPPTGREEVIEQVRAANTPDDSRRSSKTWDAGSTARSDKTQTQRSESRYSDDFDDDNKPSEKSRGTGSETKETSSRTSSNKAPKQNNRKKGSNHGNKPPQQTYERRMPQFTWSDRPKTAIYDPASQKFKPDPKPLSEDDLHASVERLSEPKKTKQRDLPPIEEGAKTYTGKGLKQAQVEDMIDRLTQFDKDKGPSDSRRVTPEDAKNKKGLMHSFVWTGRW